MTIPELYTLNATLYFKRHFILYNLHFILYITCNLYCLYRLFCWPYLWFVLFVLYSPYFSIPLSIFPERLLLFALVLCIFYCTVGLFILILCSSTAAGLVLHQANCLQRWGINKVVPYRVYIYIYIYIYTVSPAVVTAPCCQ